MTLPPLAPNAVNGKGVAREAALCALLSIATLFALRYGNALNLGDEGFQYLLSRSWAAGDSLYDRFQVLYPTGQYVYFGSLLRLLGDGLWVLRLGQAILAGLGVALLYAAIRPFTATPWLAALAAASSTLAGAKPETLFATGLVGFATLRLADLIDSGRPGHGPAREPDAAMPVRPLFVALTAGLGGVLAGFREDSAVLLLVVAVAAVLWRRRPLEIITLVVPAAVAGFLPWLLVASLRGEALAFADHALHRLLFLVERLGDPTEVTSPPLGRPRNPRHLAHMLTPTLAVIPVVVYSVVLATQALRWWWKRTSDPTLWAAGLLGLAYLPQFLWERPDLSHFQSHLPVLLTVAAVAGGRSRPSVRRWLTALLTSVLTILAVGNWAQRSHSSAVPYPTAEARRIGARLHTEPPDWAGLAHQPDETLIVLGWSPGWHVLEGIEPGSRYLSTFPRHLDAAARRELSADLRRQQNRWVIVTGWFRPELPAEVLEVLDDEYVKVARFGAYHLWERSAAGAP